MSENPAAHCPQKLGHIYEYLDGALSCQELQEMDQHLQSCTECSSEYDLECVIRSVVKRSCCETAPESLKHKIWEKLKNIDSESSSNA